MTFKYRYIEPSFDSAFVQGVLVQHPRVIDRR